MTISEAQESMIILAFAIDSKEKSGECIKADMRQFKKLAKIINT